MKHEIIATEEDMLAFGSKDGPVVNIRFNGDILVNGEFCDNPEVIVMAIREAARAVGTGPCNPQHEITPTGGMSTFGPYDPVDE